MKNITRGMGGGNSEYPFVDLTGDIVTMISQSTDVYSLQFEKDQLYAVYNGGIFPLYFTATLNGNDVSDKLKYIINADFASAYGLGTSEGKRYFGVRLTENDGFQRSGSITFWIEGDENSKVTIELIQQTAPFTVSFEASNTNGSIRIDGTHTETIKYICPNSPDRVRTVMGELIDIDTQSYNTLDLDNTKEFRCRFLFVLESGEERPAFARWAGLGSPSPDDLCMHSTHIGDDEQDENGYFDITNIPERGTALMTNHSYTFRFELYPTLEDRNNARGYLKGVSIGLDLIANQVVEDA